MVGDLLERTQLFILFSIPTTRLQRCPRTIQPVGSAGSPARFPEFVALRAIGTPSCFTPTLVGGTAVSATLWHQTRWFTSLAPWRHHRPGKLPMQKPSALLSPFFVGRKAHRVDVRNGSRTRAESLARNASTSQSPLSLRCPSAQTRNNGANREGVRERLLNLGFPPSAHILRLSEQQQQF